MGGNDAVAVGGIEDVDSAGLDDEEVDVRLAGLDDGLPGGEVFGAGHGAKEGHFIGIERGEGGCVGGEGHKDSPSVRTECVQPRLRLLYS